MLSIALSRAMSLYYDCLSDKANLTYLICRLIAILQAGQGVGTVMHLSTHSY